MSSISNFINAVCEVLNTNCNSLVTDNANANVWSKSTLDIGDAWLTANSDPNKQNVLQTDIIKLLSAAKDPINDEVLSQALHTFFDSLKNKKYPLPMWSMDLISQLQGVIGSSTIDKDKDILTVWNGMITQYSSLIQSQSGQETSTGDAENKTCQSALQNASSAGQPATNAGDSMMGLLSNGSSVQAQISV